MLLDAMGNASYGMIARLFGVSEVAVFKWIRKEEAALPEPATPAEAEIVQRDEMWHFVEGKKPVLALASLRSARGATP